MVIHVELFGIPRQRAGTPTVCLEFGGERVALAAVVDELARRFPGLAAAAAARAKQELKTDLAACLADPQYQIYFDAQTTSQRAPAVKAAIAAGKKSRNAIGCTKIPQRGSQPQSSSC